MKLHFYTRYFEFYLCLGKLYDIIQDDWHKQGISLRVGRYCYHSRSGFKNLKKAAITTDQYHSLYTTGQI